jgi:hypothetical protein
MVHQFLLAHKQVPTAAISYGEEESFRFAVKFDMKDLKWARQAMMHKQVADSCETPRM